MPLDCQANSASKKNISNLKATKFEIFYMQITAVRVVIPGTVSGLLNHFFCFASITLYQISANQGNDSRFVLEVNLKGL